MNPESVASIKKIIAEQLNVSASDVSEDKDLLKDLGADSLDAVELIMLIEDHFDIEIKDSDAEKITTVQSIIDLVLPLYLKKAAN